MRVLIVGAGGFAGGFIAREGLNRGLEVWAGIRNSTSREYLQDPALKFIEFDFNDPAAIARALSNALSEGEKWDWIIYNLGATKCLRFSDFNLINCQYLANFIDALKASGKVPDKFLFISSLSAMGPGAGDGRPFVETMIPTPDTRYGASKLKAEMLLQMSGIPFVIFRATGLYGPRDKDYFLMFESIAKGADFSVGFKPQRLTFLYIEDLARACYDALKKAPAGETYIVAHPREYTQAQFRKIASRRLGKRFVVPVRVPLWGLKIVSAIAEKIGAAKGKPSTLNRDKYHIMRQRNWTVDVAKARRDFGFNPTVDLEEGVDRSITWYQQHGWLKDRK